MLRIMLSPEEAPNIAPIPLVPVMFASTYPADMASEREYFGIVNVGAGVGEAGELGVEEGVGVKGIGVMVDPGEGEDGSEGMGVCGVGV